MAHYDTDKPYASDPIGYKKFFNIKRAFVLVHEKSCYYLIKNNIIKIVSRFVPIVQFSSPNTEILLLTTSPNLLQFVLIVIHVLSDDFHS